MENSVIRLNASVYGAASVVGKKETEGPLGRYFTQADTVDGKDLFGKATFEEAEDEMQRRAFSLALKNAQRREAEIGALFAGDLQNQCTASAYGLLNFAVPYFGLYGACSTAAEGILLASVLASTGVYAYTAAVTSSHNASAERQYRTPLSYGGQRTPTAQWTVTGAGAFIIGRKDAKRVRITAAMPGIVGNFGINDTNNMGAAMAPAAVDTLLRFLKETNTTPANYDLIFTGDLGYEGGAIFAELCKTQGVELGTRYQDCGQMIYTRQWQDTHAGGSGCGCSAAVLASYIIPGLENGNWQRVLMMGTGAMMSPDRIKQGKDIPSIAHLVEFCAPEE